MPEGPPAQPAVIVVSSHVARGAVGSRGIVFALQSLGFPVWSVPTVMLPWHPGHGPATRIVPETGKFSAFIEDLRRAPWLGEVGAVLSGYLGAAEQAGPVAGLVEAVKASNPSALYLCDPIVGDGSGLYVPQATAEAIRDRLMPLADIATPNRFELGWLTGQALPDNAAIIDAARAAGPSTMLVTSAHAHDEGDIGNLLVTAHDAFLIEHDAVAKPPNGTGDLMSALFLAGLLDGEGSEKSIRKAAASVLDIVRHAKAHGADELMLEANVRSLSHPSATTAATRLDRRRAGQ